MNWPVLIAIGIAAAALIGFLVWQNLKDEKKFEEKIKQDYRKSRDEEDDAEIDHRIK